MIHKTKPSRQLQLPASSAAVVFGGHLSARAAFRLMTALNNNKI